MLAGSINQIQVGYINVYDRMISEYTTFYEDVTKFTGRLPNYISEGSDQNHIKVDIGKIDYELRALRKSWHNRPVFGPSTPADAQKWVKEWKLPLTGYSTTDQAYVVIDTSPIDIMIGATGANGKTFDFYSLPPPEEASQTADWLLGEYQAWDTAMTEQRKQIQTKVTTLNEQYSHAISIFDNIVKVLSSTINSLHESEKLYLQSL